ARGRRVSPSTRPTRARVPTARSRAPTASASGCARVLEPQFASSYCAERTIDMTNVTPVAGTTELILLYRRMVTIRRCEEAVGRLFNDGLVHGTAHLSIGQEATPAAVCAELRDDDFLTTTYRGHGWALAKGVPLADFFAELFGRETGVCRGRGGSMHLCDMRVGLIGASGIVGGGLPAAVAPRATLPRVTGPTASSSRGLRAIRSS